MLEWGQNEKSKGTKENIQSNYVSTTYHHRILKEISLCHAFVNVTLYNKSSFKLFGLNSVDFIQRTQSVSMQEFYFNGQLLEPVNIIKLYYIIHWVYLKTRRRGKGEILSLCKL